MIWITGDTHADFSRLHQPLPAPKRYRPSRKDYLIICGDFGGIWASSPEQTIALNRLARLPFTILFLDGNHENYDMLKQFPVRKWNGGRVHVIRENVLHLLRGQVFTLEGKTFFTMGGAACHDIQDGVLDPADWEFDAKYREFRSRDKFFRIKHYTWWEEELPCEAELEEGLCALSAHGHRVDYILTHCAPTRLQNQIASVLGNDTYPVNTLTEYLQRIFDQCAYSHWFCGHYHRPMELSPTFHVLYEPICVLPASSGI